MSLENIKNLSINTPLIQIDCKYMGKKHKIFAKCEWFSLTGSIKDKVAYQIFFDAYKMGKLKQNDKVIEVSSGNMGISIVAMGNLFHNPVTIIMPKNMSEERKKLIKMYGGNLIEIDDFKNAFVLCNEYIKNGYFCTKQFENESNYKAHYNLTAKEIFFILKNKNVKVFVAGVGTSGTLTGIGKFLKNKMNIKVFAIEPQNSQILSGGKPNHHKLQGLSDEIVPKLFDKKIVDKFLPISDNDAIAMSQKLAKVLSLGVGISSGANFLGAVLSRKNAVTIFPDDNKKYISTDLSKDINTNLVDSIELLNLKVL